MNRDLTGKRLRALRALATRRVTIECDRMPFVFEHVPRRKILNWILVEASMLIKPERPWGWPTRLAGRPRCHKASFHWPAPGSSAGTKRDHPAGAGPAG